MQPAHPQPVPSASGLPNGSGLPNDVAKPLGVGGIEYSALRPIKTICGMRRRVFFVILAVAIVAIVAGLSAGLGVALSKNNNSPSTVTVTAGAGAGEDSPGRTTSNGADSRTDPSEGASNPFGRATSTTSSRTSTPADATSTPSNPSASTTPPPGSEPAVATQFPIETGFWTITFSKYSTSGNLCSYFNNIHPVSTVVEPWVQGSVDRGYRASWQQTSSQVVLDKPSTTVTIQGERYSATATFLAQAVTNVPAWDFEKTIVPTVFGCEFRGSVHLLFEETGRMRYVYSVNLGAGDVCTIEDQTMPEGSSCSLFWRLVKSN
ncbi:hypothetical protein TWF730_010254 [Orbilia blumenaviensis]|uniref:Uncharacterized protein n=1 Tax=Orbilia blumenaviensis TaxID=1796055 RepID=A0AAV9UMN9_9PEZI